MIPVLYDKTGANKIGDLIDSIECYVEEERNGIFELTMVYPANTALLDNLCYENIIVVDANDYLKNQKFRIYNTRKLMSNRIEICARHISFDLAHDWIDALSINNQSCEYALNMIFKKSQFSSHFKGHSDIINAQDYAINETTCLGAIGGSEGSIIDTFGTGAEILRDNTDIHVLNRRGSDNDVSIEYRKNLTGLEVEEDTTDLVTRILPYATYTDDDSNEIKVKGSFVDSSLINNYAHPYVKYIDYSENFDEDNLPTASKLESLAKKEYINNKVDIPKMNYKIEFIPLSKCAGYEGLEDKINLCDTVTIRDTRYGIDTQSKVIKVTYDALRDRYDSMELGEPRTTLGDIIGGTGDSTQGPPGPQGPQGPAGADGSIGDFPSTLPETPTITTKVYGFANVEVSWTFENKVYYSYELYASKTKGFVPNTFNLIFEGQASTFLHQVNPNETWYYRACAINSHGSRTEFSDEVEVSTVKITDLSNYVESAAISDALIGELNLGRGWVGELKGNYIDAKQLSVTDGNGKRTLDIDSFGNVNLDVASLKIKNNSVATESFVSTAKNEAINSANNTLNTTIANYYTKSETDSAISVAKDAVTTSVSNLRSEVMSATYTNLLENSDFLILDSGFPRGYSRYTTDSNTSVSMSAWSLDGGKAVRITSTGQTDNVWIAMFSPFVKAYKGETFTASAFITTNDYTAIDNQVAVEIEWHSDSGRIGTSAYFFTKTYNGWERQSVTGTAPSGTTKARVRVHVVKNGTIYVTKMMLQTGGILTNWVKGGNIDSVTERLASAEQKITDESITNTVKKNFYTKEETNNAITSKGYATQSQVQQTADSLQIKFTESGGYNLFKNSKFHNGHGGSWWNHAHNNPQGSCSFRSNVDDWGFPDSNINTIEYTLPVGKSSVEWGVAQTIKTTVGKKYTISFYYAAHRCTRANLIVRNPDGSWHASHTWDPSSYSGGNSDASKWGYKTYTFTATQTQFTVNIVMNNCSDSSMAGYFWITKPMCEEGSVATAYSPAPDEVLTGITTIDKDGIAVTHSNANTKSTMSADGFKVVRTTDNKELFNASNGNLTMEGVLTTGNSGKYVKVSDSNYKVYNGSTQKAFFGLFDNDTFTAPRLSLSADAVGSSNYDDYSISMYKRNDNPSDSTYDYMDMSYNCSKLGDYSNMKMFGNGDIKLSPVRDLEISSNYHNGTYDNPNGHEYTVAKFSTSPSSYYNGNMEIGAVVNKTNGNGLVLEDSRNSRYSSVQVYVNPDTGERSFRPMPAQTGTVYSGTSNATWKAVYSSSGSVQTSDERYKMKMGVLNNLDCFEMVKNTDIYKYCMLPTTKDSVSTNELKKIAKKSSTDDVSIQAGIMAQDLSNYDCAKYILTHDFWVDEDTGEEREKYNINPYAFATAIMGALQVEIKKREELEKEVFYLKNTILTN